MRRRLALALLSSLAAAGHATAEPPTRGLLAPSESEPVRVEAGEKLALLVRVASGLTPPPGVQSERALRGFVVRLCKASSAVPPVADPPCRALSVRNVRPVDGHSFVYRVEVPTPATFAAGSYDLELRYPGGEASLAQAVLVEPNRTPSRPVSAGSAPAPIPSVAGCAVHTGHAGHAVQGSTPGDGVRGLLLLALSWRLAAMRRGRGRRWNSVRATLVTERP